MTENRTSEVYGRNVPLQHVRYSQVIEEYREDYLR